MINPKPNLIKIAWMRNWFQSWLSTNWIGNYDLLLTTSAISSSFFQSFDNYPIVCYNQCPSALKMIRKRKPTNGSTYLFILFIFIDIFIVEIFRIATNFCQNSLLNKTKSIVGSKYDYIFTGNYWKVPREIMKLNPAKLPKYRGAVFGTGWRVNTILILISHFVEGRNLILILFLLLLL